MGSGIVQGCCLLVFTLYNVLYYHNKKEQPNKTVNIAKYLLKYNTEVGFSLFLCVFLLLPGTISLIHRRLTKAY